MTPRILLPALCLFVSCSHSPPVAPVHEHRTEIHGTSVSDPYHWLKNRESAETIAYLEAENASFERKFSAVRGLRKEILSEMRSRIDEDDSTPPAKDGPYLYYGKYVPGADFLVICRKLAAGGTEEILLDTNQRAKGQTYYQNRGAIPSDDHRLLAFAEDFVGRRFYTIRIKDLRTGELLADAIRDVTSNFVWANDNRTIFYVKQDPKTLRSDRVFRHRLGETQDQEVYYEPDTTYETRISKSLDGKSIVLHIDSTMATEVRLLDAANPESRFTLFEARRRGHEYFVAPAGDRHYILTNDRAKNFRLMEAPLGRTSRANWKEVFAHRKDTYLTSLIAFKDHLVLLVKRGGLPGVDVLDRKSRKPRLLKFEDPTYAVGFGSNYEYDTRTLRLEYESLRIPESAYDYDLVSGERKLVQRKKVLGGFDPERYETRWLFVKARDGSHVPVSLIHKKGIKLDGTNPLLIDGYGAYGNSVEPYFSSTLISLYERGFIYAVAHVRGGSELGREWYENGRQRQKMNTFQDFIDVTKALQTEGYSSPAHTYGWGASAGGLLVGATTNLEPALYNGMVAQVPFVDVINTMLDDSIPLTTSEYDEWGDPRERDDYEYIRRYSPYENVRKARYPHLLVTAGLHDSQVQYWEAAKWVARVRQENPASDRLVLLKTDLKSGHGGKAGRFQRLELLADILAFLAGVESGLLAP